LGEDVSLLFFVLDCRAIYLAVSTTATHVLVNENKPAVFSEGVILSAANDPCIFPCVKIHGFFAFA
jgi:hypothetical protein